MAEENQTRTTAVCTACGHTWTVRNPEPTANRKCSRCGCVDIDVSSEPVSTSPAGTASTAGAIDTKELIAELTRKPEEPNEPEEEEIMLDDTGASILPDGSGFALDTLYSKEELKKTQKPKLKIKPHIVAISLGIVAGITAIIIASRRKSKKKVVVPHSQPVAAEEERTRAERPAIGHYSMDGA